MVIESTTEALTSRLAASSDTSVREASPFANYGNATTLVVTANSKALSPSNGIIRFSQSELASSVGSLSVYSARIELPIQSIDPGWGGGRIVAYRMVRDWSEGTGIGSRRAKGHGPTWACAEDTDTSASNAANTCSTPEVWRLGSSGPGAPPHHASASGSSRLYSAQGSTTILIDVTSDVRDFLSGTSNFGWMLQGLNETRSGTSVAFHSRQSTAAAPGLVLETGPDLCPTDNGKVQPGVCGCGQADTDTDRDGTPDCDEPSLVPVADTSLNIVTPTVNYGTGPRLGVTAVSIAGLERALVRFDQAAIASTVTAAGGTLFSAHLELTVVGLGVGWHGGSLDVVPMNVAWEEGNGTDAVLGAHGATWRCADDSLTAGSGFFFDNCTAARKWGMNPWDATKPYGATPAASAAIHSGKSRVLRFDVTSDVQRFLNGTANHGWILKGREGLLDGTWVHFGSRESGAPPRLILNASAPCPATGPAIDTRSDYRALECLDTDNEATACNLQAQASANADRRAGALHYVRKLFSPAETLVLTRDRGAKLKALYAKPDLLSAFCAGDEDGDMVPDSADDCPGTRRLRPTDEHGCEDTTLPITPPREAIDGILATMGVMVDPRCEGAPHPAILDFSPQTISSRHAFFYPRGVRRPGTPVYIISLPSAFADQPADCELEFQLAVQTVHADGAKRFTTLTFSSHNDPRVDRHYPTNHTHLYIWPADGGDGSLWGTDTTTVGLSAQVVNGNGERSGWSATQWETVLRVIE